MTRVSFTVAAMLSFGSTAQADVDHRDVAERAVSGHVLPAYERLSAATEAFEDAAETCEAEPMRAAYHVAFDAWMGAAHLAFGPAEEEGRMFAIAF